MNRKVVITGIILLLLVAGSGLYFGNVLKLRNSVGTQAEQTPTPAPVELEVWKDQSEFEFSYPKNLKLDPHPEDNENYAHLELTSNAFPGNIILWTRDTDYQSIEGFVKGEKIENQIGSTLGTLPAAKILDTQNANKFSLIAIRNGYHYEIEVDSKGEKVWNEVFNTVADSYKFTDSEPTLAPVAAIQDTGSYTEEFAAEEVIE